MKPSSIRWRCLDDFVLIGARLELLVLDFLGRALKVSLFGSRALETPALGFLVNVLDDVSSTLSSAPVGGRFDEFASVEATAMENFEGSCIVFDAEMCGFFV